MLSFRLLLKIVSPKHTDIFFSFDKNSCVTTGALKVKLFFKSSGAFSGKMSALEFHCYKMLGTQLCTITFHLALYQFY